MIETRLPMINNTLTTATTIGFDKLPSTSCNGFTDVHGMWINS